METCGVLTNLAHEPAPSTQGFLTVISALWRQAPLHLCAIDPGHPRTDESLLGWDVTRR